MLPKKTFLLPTFFLSFLLFSCGNNASQQTTNKEDATAATQSSNNEITPQQNDAKRSPIAQDFTGTWIDNRDRAATETSLTDGTFSICPEGEAVYIVFSNQLIYNFTVRQKETGPQSAVLEFYFKESEHGRGFAEADLKEPAAGTLVATAELSAEFEMEFTYTATAFTDAVRAGSPQDANHFIFPKHFYFGSRVENPMVFCESK